MERGLMPMSKNKKILMMLAKGGASQSDIAAALHVSKRDVSAGAKAIKEYGLTFDAVSTMDADVVDDLFFPKDEREPNDAYLQQDMAPLVERKKRNRKLPVKLFWIEYCERVPRPPGSSRTRTRCSRGCSPRKRKGWMPPGTSSTSRGPSAS